MSSTVQILLLDDIDGSPADETVEFALDGASFEIDLSKRNALAMRQMLARYIKSARRVSGTRGIAAKPSSHRNGRVVVAAGSRGAATKGTRTSAGAGRSQGAGRSKSTRAASSRGTSTRGTSTRATATRGATARGAATRSATTRTQAKSRTIKRGSQNPAQVREWARSQGISVSERGRISADLIAKFQDAVR